MANQRISLKDVEIYLGDTRVGGAQSMTITETAEDTVEFEGGSYFAAEVVDGKITVTGTLERHYLDSDLLNDIGPDGSTGLKPSFTLVAQTQNKTPQRTVTVFGCKFNTREIALELDGISTNSLPFNALRMELQ